MSLAEPPDQKFHLQHVGARESWCPTCSSRGKCYRTCPGPDENGLSPSPTSVGTLLSCFLTLGPLPGALTSLFLGCLLSPSFFLPSVFQFFAASQAEFLEGLSEVDSVVTGNMDRNWIWILDNVISGWGWGENGQLRLYRCVSPGDTPIHIFRLICTYAYIL